MRTTRHDVKAIATRSNVFELLPGQHFCEMPKAWELWQDDPPTRLKRWDKKRVYWFIP